MKLNLDANGEPYKFELEESVQNYIFEEKIKPRKDEEELKNIQNLILHYFSKQVR